VSIIYSGLMQDDGKISAIYGRSLKKKQNILFC
jgi:hypothetical protein